MQSHIHIAEIVYLNIPTSRKGLGAILPHGIVVAHKLE